MKKQHLSYNINPNPQPPQQPNSQHPQFTILESHKKYTILKQYQTQQSIEILRKQIKQTVLPNFIVKSEECSLLNSIKKTMIRQNVNTSILIQLFGELAKKLYVDQCDTVERMLGWIREGKYRISDEMVFEMYQDESFFYKMINNILRFTKNITILYYTQPFVKALFNAIRRKYQKDQIKQSNLQQTYYRGATFTESQLTFFKQNKGKKIQLLGFMSTSQLYLIAQAFVGNVILKITVRRTNITLNRSYGYCKMVNTVEKEVLFNIFNVFTIGEVKEKDGFVFVDLEYGDVGDTQTVQKYGEQSVEEEELPKDEGSAQEESYTNEDTNRNEEEQYMRKIYNHFQRRQYRQLKSSSQLRFILQNGCLQLEKKQRPILLFQISKILLSKNIYIQQPTHNKTISQNRQTYKIFKNWFLNQLNNMIKYNTIQQMTQIIIKLFHLIKQMLQEFKQQCHDRDKSRKRTNREAVIAIFRFVFRIKLLVFQIGEDVCGKIEGKGQFVGIEGMVIGICEVVLDLVRVIGNSQLILRQLQFYQCKIHKLKLKYPEISTTYNQLQQKAKNTNPPSFQFSSLSTSDPRTRLTPFILRTLQSSFLINYNPIQRDIISSCNEYFMQNTVIKQKDFKQLRKLIQTCFSRDNQFVHLVYLRKIERNFINHQYLCVVFGYEEYMGFVGDADYGKYKDVKGQIIGYYQSAKRALKKYKKNRNQQIRIKLKKLQKMSEQRIQNKSKSEYKAKKEFLNRRQNKQSQEQYSEQQQQDKINNKYNKNPNNKIQHEQTETDNRIQQLLRQVLKNTYQTIEWSIATPNPNNIPQQQQHRQQHKQKQQQQHKQKQKQQQKQLNIENTINSDKKVNEDHYDEIYHSIGYYVGFVIGVVMGQGNVLACQ